MLPAGSLGLGGGGEGGHLLRKQTRPRLEVHLDLLQHVLQVRGGAVDHAVGPQGADLVDKLGVDRKLSWSSSLVCIVLFNRTLSLYLHTVYLYIYIHGFVLMVIVCIEMRREM